MELSASAPRQLVGAKPGWFRPARATTEAGFPAPIIEIDEVLWGNFRSLA